MNSKAVTILMVLAVVAVGCSSEEARPLPEIPGSSTENVDEVSTSTSSSLTTTSTTASTTTTSTTTTTLDPTALIVAEQFPGITFPAASLPTEAGSINNNRAPATTEKDLALIAAFVDVANAAISVQQDPSDTTAYALAPLASDLRASVTESAQARAAAGQVLDVSAGLTVRPYVVEQEDPSLGLVYDCSINAAVWRDETSGEPVEASTGWPQVGAPGIERGVGYLFELSGGEWLLTSAFTEPGACG